MWFLVLTIGVVAWMLYRKGSAESPRDFSAALARDLASQALRRSHIGEQLVDLTAFRDALQLHLVHLGLPDDAIDSVHCAKYFWTRGADEVVYLRTGNMAFAEMETVGIYDCVGQLSVVVAQGDRVIFVGYDAADGVGENILTELTGDGVGLMLQLVAHFRSLEVVVIEEVLDTI
jgi:hypothetical protein